MALEQEPLADAIERGDGTVHFTATAGEENGPYQFDRYVLVRGGERHPALGLSVSGVTIAARFGRPILDGDQVEVPA